MKLTFQRPELEDQKLIKEYYKKYQSKSCDRSFFNLYLWSRHDGMDYAIIEGALVVHATVEGQEYFVWPVGEVDQIKKALIVLEDYVKELGQELVLCLLTEEDFAVLETLQPGKWQITYNRDYADYVYETEKLRTLAGKKLHGKRNHINKFKSIYEDWSYETLSDDNVEEAFQMALKWRNLNGCADDPEKNSEMCVTLNSLRLYKELNLTGGILRVNGDVVAISIGEPLSDDTFCVHIEKAFTEIEGAYTVINQQFVEHECEGYTYVNREEDTGAEGLRKAKLSYRPAMLINKGEATKK